MKKTIVFLLLLSILVAMPINVLAAAPLNSSSDNASYQYFEDGSYTVTTLTLTVIDDGVTTCGAEPESYNLQAKQDVSYHDANNNLDWVVTITAVFLVCPACAVSGMCQSSELSANIYDTSWGMYNVDERCMSNNAYGACSMKDKFLGITTMTVNVEFTLTCDRYGNVTVLGQ